MPRRPLAVIALLIASAPALLSADDAKPSATAKGRVFEMRTYIPHPGRSEAMHKRFRDHTCGLFKKHGMELIGFWTPRDEKNKDNLVYILAFPNKEAATASWKAFGTDPEWIKVRDASEKDGKIVKEVISVYMDPTDYSDIK